MRQSGSKLSHEAFRWVESGGGRDSPKRVLLSLRFVRPCNLIRYKSIMSDQFNFYWTKFIPIPIPSFLEGDVLLLDPKTKFLSLVQRSDPERDRPLGLLVQALVITPANTALRRKPLCADCTEF